MDDPEAGSADGTTKEDYVQEQTLSQALGTCAVKSDGKLWCGNTPGAPIRAARQTSAAIVDHLRTTYSWFDCWDTGAMHAGGNTTWYHTWGDDHDAAGWVAAVDLGTSSQFDANPSAYGLRRCTSSTAKTLPYTWHGQETGYFCGPASTQIALSARGKVVSQTALAAALGTTTDGTSHIGLVRNALNAYLQTSWFETKPISDPPTAQQRTLLKADIVFNIDHGYPLVANVVSGWRPAGYPSGLIYHYVAIIGYDQKGARVLIADPAGACAGGSSWCNVPKSYWISVDDLATWIGGKGYTA